MANRYTVVLWQGDMGFQAVIPALGMAPVFAETRRAALDLCHDVALDRLAMNAATGVPTPHDVKVSTDHLTIRDDGQTRNVGSQFVPLLNAAMSQITLQVGGNPEAVRVAVEWFSEMVTILREVNLEVSPLLVGSPMSEALYTPKRLSEVSDDVLDDFIDESDLSDEDAERLRVVVREALASELPQVPPLDLGFLSDPLGPLAGLLGPLNDEIFADPDLLNPFITGLPSDPPQLGPMQHPPSRKSRKRG